MKFLKTPLPDVLIIEPVMHGDERGFFMETWHYQRFTEAGIDAPFVQDNHSKSQQHTLRGLHYQVRQAQGKLIRVIEGAIFDVVVDLRRQSATFGQWYGHELSADNRQLLWCPPGFAHGFLVTSDSAQVCYKCTDYYAPEHERSLRWDDPQIGIQWPLQPGTEPLLSDKDRNAQLFSDIEAFE